MKGFAQDGVRVTLPEGMTWETLAALSPEQVIVRASRSSP